jgi:ATP-dependent helicase/DNAse subunit B
VSATSLDDYQACPQKWFFTYIIKLPRRLAEGHELSSADEGKIIHELLAAFFKNYSSPLSEQAINAHLDELWHNLPEFNSHEFVIQSRKRKLLAQVLRVIKFEIEHLDLFKPWKTEFELPRLALLNPGAPPYLRGRLDRLDKYQDIIRITDYKNILPNQLNQEYKTSDGNKTASLQMPLYIAAVGSLYPHHEIQARILSTREPERGERKCEPEQDLYTIWRRCWDGIRNADFQPHPHSPQCVNCEYEMICQAAGYEENVIV